MHIKLLDSSPEGHTHCAGDSRDHAVTAYDLTCQSLSSSAAASSKNTSQMNDASKHTPRDLNTSLKLLMNRNRTLMTGQTRS